nr:hypothetical protein Iba_chr06dCG8150 [Ipomoea batatas]
MLCLATAHHPADAKDTETTVVQSLASTLAHSVVGRRLLAWSPAVSYSFPGLRLHPQTNIIFFMASKLFSGLFLLLVVASCIWSGGEAKEYNGLACKTDKDCGAPLSACYCFYLDEYCTCFKKPPRPPVGPPETPSYKH